MGFIIVAGQVHENQVMKPLVRIQIGEKAISTFQQAFICAMLPISLSRVAIAQDAAKAVSDVSETPFS